VGIFVVEGDELKRMGLSSTKLADGSGSIATINVFHQLHCLVRALNPVPQILGSVLTFLVASVGSFAALGIWGG